MAEPVQITAAQAAALRNIRRRVEATHWIKGAFAKIKNARTGQFAPGYSPDRRGKVEAETFVGYNEQKYKTCACLLGLMRWEIGGDRRVVPRSKAYPKLVQIVAEHLIATGRVSERAITKIKERSLVLPTAFNLREAIIASWNDRDSTSRADVTEMLAEIIES